MVHQDIHVLPPVLTKLSSVVPKCMIVTIATCGIDDYKSVWWLMKLTPSNYDDATLSCKCYPIPRYSCPHHKPVCSSLIIVLFFAGSGRQDCSGWAQTGSALHKLQGSGPTMHLSGLVRRRTDTVCWIHWQPDPCLAGFHGSTLDCQVTLVLKLRIFKEESWLLEKKWIKSQRWTRFYVFCSIKMVLWLVR